VNARRFLKPCPARNALDHGAFRNPAPEEQTMSVERIANPFRIAGRRVSATTPGPFARVWFSVAIAMERRRALALVGQMDDRMLRDIGIHRGDADRAIRYGREDAKPVLPWWDR
jgi:uncharacterized protein YjiS (DUF1127 family)